MPTKSKPKEFLPPELTIFNSYLIYFLTRILHILTRFPPFSYLWQDRFFHHQNLDIYRAREKVQQIMADLGGWFQVLEVEREHHFLILTGKFTMAKKSKSLRGEIPTIIDKLEREGYFMRKAQKGQFSVFINQN